MAAQESPRAEIWLVAAGAGLTELRNAFGASLSRAEDGLQRVTHPEIVRNLSGLALHAYSPIAAWFSSEIWLRPDPGDRACCRVRGGSSPEKIRNLWLGHKDELLKDFAEGLRNKIGRDWFDANVKGGRAIPASVTDWLTRAVLVVADHSVVHDRPEWRPQITSKEQPNYLVELEVQETQELLHGILIDDVHLLMCGAARQGQSVQVRRSQSSITAVLKTVSELRGGVQLAEFESPVRGAPRVWDFVLARWDSSGVRQRTARVLWSDGCNSEQIEGRWFPTGTFHQNSNSEPKAIPVGSLVEIDRRPIGLVIESNENQGQGSARVLAIQDLLTHEDALRALGLLGVRTAAARKFGAAVQAAFQDPVIGRGLAHVSACGKTTCEPECWSTASESEAAALQRSPSASNFATKLASGKFREFVKVCHRTLLWLRQGEPTKESSIRSALRKLVWEALAGAHMGTGDVLVLSGKLGEADVYDVASFSALYAGAVMRRLRNLAVGPETFDEDFSPRSAITLPPRALERAAVRESVQGLLKRAFGGVGPPQLRHLNADSEDWMEEAVAALRAQADPVVVLVRGRSHTVAQCIIDASAYLGTPFPFVVFPETRADDTDSTFVAELMELLKPDRSHE